MSRSEFESCRIAWREATIAALCCRPSFDCQFRPPLFCNRQPRHVDLSKLLYWHVCNRGLIVPWGKRKANWTAENDTLLGHFRWTGPNLELGPELYASMVSDWVDFYCGKQTLSQIYLLIVMAQGRDAYRCSITSSCLYEDKGRGGEGSLTVTQCSYRACFTVEREPIACKKCNKKHWSKLHLFNKISRSWPNKIKLSSYRELRQKVSCHLSVL